MGEKEDQEKGEVVGYCQYCKEDIYEENPYVVLGEDKYHIEHYLLLNETIIR